MERDRPRAVARPGVLKGSRETTEWNWARLLDAYESGLPERCWRSCDSPTRVNVFARNSTTGALTEVQCIAEAPAPTGCTAGRVIGNMQALAITPDGKHAHGFDGGPNGSLSVFDRNLMNGRLTQKSAAAGCFSDSGADNTGSKTCTAGRVLSGSYVIVISPNGNTLYDLAASDGGCSSFHIKSDGTLSQLSGTAGCTTNDGFDNHRAHTCSLARLMLSPEGAGISPDGRTLYTSSSRGPVGGIAAFSLNPATGAATQLRGLSGCTSTDGTAEGTANQCVVGRAVTVGYGLSVSPDGLSVYQATEEAGTAGLAMYSREAGPTCAAASAKTAFDAPVKVSLSCVDRDGDPVSIPITHRPAHRSLSRVNPGSGVLTSTPANGFSGTDAFTFDGSDGLNSSPSASATIIVGEFTGVTLVSNTLPLKSHHQVTLQLDESVALNGAGRTLAPRGKFDARVLLTSHVGPSGKLTRTYRVTVKP